MEANFWDQEEQQQLLLPQNNAFQDLQETSKQLLKMELEALLKCAEKISSKMADYMKTLTESIESNSFIKIPMKIEYEIENPTESPICSKTVGYSPATNRIFKCFDCMQAGNAIQCPTCFFAANHQGHNYRQMYSGEGCCDCGNNQMLNPRGFCPAHSKQVKQIETDPLVKVMFLKETTFLTYVCFWLLQRVQKFKMNKIMGIQNSRELFNTLLKFSRKNYDFKVLCFMMLKQKLGEKYPELPQIQNKNLSIIEIVFLMSASSFMQSFCRLMYEIFPVEQSKTIVIKLYFNKSQTDGSFGFNHPLRFLNFQFMTCIKAINLLIKQNQLKAIRLPAVQKLEPFGQDNNGLNLLFVRFIDDMQYPSTMKGIKQYYQNLVQKQQITTIFFTYRQLPDYYINKPLLDQYYLKTFRHLITSIIEKKDLLRKVIVQLWRYIVKVKTINVSLVHERAFAIAVTALFEGNIRLLSNPRYQEQLLQLLGISYDNIRNVLPPVIQIHLQSILASLFQRIVPIKNDHISQYFLATNPEKEISFKCDCSYQKILLLISFQSIDFTTITDRLISKFLSSENQSIKILKLMTFLNSVFAVDADEISLQSFIGLKSKQKIFQFYRKFVTTFIEKRGVQIKKQLLYVNSDNDFFQQFVKDNCTFEKGFIKLKQQIQRLQYYSYDSFFKAFSIEMSKLEKNRHSLTFLPQFQNLRLWSEESIDYLIMVCNSYNEQLTKMEKQSKYVSRLTDQTFGFELVKLYSQSYNQKLHTYLHQMLLPYSKQKNWMFLLKHLQIVLNLTEIQVKQVVSLNMEQLAMRKDKLLQKKKGHLQKIKKQSEQILKIHQQQKQQDLDQKDICIFCRQKTEQNLNLIAEITVDNFVTKSIFKSNSLMLFFRSCSHRIHQKCFFQNNSKNNMKCFLCRLPSNILIPIFTDLKEPNMQLCENLLNLFYPTLNLQYENQIPMINSFYDNQCKGNMLRGVLNSLIMQILMASWNESVSFKLNIIPIWKQMIALVKLMPLHEIDHAFAIDQQVMQLSCQNQLYKHIRDLLLNYFKSDSNKQSPNKELAEEKSEIEKIFNRIIMFMDGSCEFDSVINLKELTLIKCNQQVFNIPKKLSVLQQFMGKCPDCSVITEKMCICLICGWKACFKRRQVLRDHSKMHLNGTILIKCDTGQLVFILNQGMFSRKSIYVNYIGETYILKDFLSAEPENYYVDQQQYAEICNSIVKNRLRTYMLKELS